jgi:hypothetical protein
VIITARLDRLKERCVDYLDTGIEIHFHTSALKNTSIQVYANEGLTLIAHVWVCLNGNSKQRRQQKRAAMRQVVNLFKSH